MLEDIKILLEETLLVELVLSLTLSKLSILYLSISITTLEDKLAIWAKENVKAKEKKCIFLISLLDATMQDSNMRKRRNNYNMLTL